MIKYNKIIYERLEMKSLKFIRLIFAIAFSIPLIFFAISLSNYIKDANLVNHGKEALATVTDYKSDVIINDVPYYYLSYEFEGDDGNIHTGRTNSDYTYNKASSIKTLKIKYDEKYNSINADFKLGFRTELIVLPLFGLLGIGLWISVIISFKNKIIDKKIIKLGKEKYATFVTSGSSIKVNDVSVYYVTYQYNDEHGKLKTTKTSCSYSLDEVKFFSALQKFKIKIYKGRSCITEDIDMSKIKYDVNGNPQRVIFKRCIYCGSQVEESVRKCPNCSSSKFEDCL